MNTESRAAGKGAKHAVTAHEQAGNDPAAWQASADELLRAATVLEERREMCDPMSPEGRLRLVELMLKGMAIECLLKAVWLKRGNKLVKDGRYAPVRGASGHDLVQLASSAGVSLTPLEKDLLRRLSHFVKYAGRYPIPKDAGALLLRRSPTGGYAAATTWSSPSDGLLFDALRQRLYELVE